MPGRQKILVVDDSPVMLGLYRTLLAPHYSVVFATNGVEALKKLDQESRIGLILLDIYMPLMDGLKVLEALRTDIRYDSIPVVVVSTGGGSAALGAVACLTKPFTAKDLLYRVADALSKPKRGRRHHTWSFRQPASGYRRIPCNESCDVSFGPSHTHGVVVNVSVRGVYVTFDGPLPGVGDATTLTFSPAEESPSITCPARVAWVNPPAISGRGAVAPDLPVGCGLEFAALAAADRARIDACVRAAAPLSI